MTETPAKKKANSKPYKLLRAAAFDVPAEGLGASVNVVDLPAPWIEAFQELASGANPGKRYSTIPIYSLNGALRALVPGLGVPLTRAGRATGQDLPWLVSETALPVQRLIPVVAAWIASQRNEHTSDALIQNTLSVVTSVPLQNDKRDLAEATGSSLTAGMRVLESQAARLLSADGVKFELGGTPLSFVRVARSDGGAGELMSWPPLPDRKNGAYSIVIRATAQTMPAAAGLSLFTHYGVRRWMDAQPFVIPGNSTSVYFHTSVPYLGATPAKPHFTMARAKSVAREIGGGRERSYEFVWDDRLMDVLRGAGAGEETLPPIQDLMANLPIFRESRANPAVVPFRYGRASRHQGVSAGLHVEDRDKLLEWTASVLGKGRGEIWAPLRRASLDAKRGQLEKKGGKLARAGLADSIVSTLGNRIDVELMMPNDSAEHALTALKARLPGFQLALDTTSTGTTSFGPLDVHVSRPRQSDELRAPLEAPAARRDQRSAKSRVGLILEVCAAARVPTVAIVEVDPAESFSKKPLLGRDPKNAVRHGLAHTGRASQFVNPPSGTTKDDQIRFDKAVDDAFRQLGLRPDSGGFRAFSPARGRWEPKYLAFSMLRRNRNKDFAKKQSLLAAVLMDEDGRNVKVRTLQSGEWQPLHVAAPSIGAKFGAEAKLHDEYDRASANFIKEVLLDLARDSTPVLLLTHAQNLRSAWPQLRNPNVGRDRLSFGDVTDPISNYPGLRHVRVRTSESSETPQVFGYDPEVIDEDSGRARVGRPRGLWQYGGDRLFASTAAKPGTNQTPQSITKFPAAGEKVGPIHNAVFNQQLVELYVAGIQPGDDPMEWAAIAHELRDANPFHLDELTLPWPLHLASKLGEYISPVYVEPEDDSTGSSVIEGTFVQEVLFEI